MIKRIRQSIGDILIAIYSKVYLYQPSQKKILPPNHTHAKIYLFTISYNNPSLIILQHKQLRRFLQDEFAYVIIDNSTNSQAQKEIAAYADENGLIYCHLWQIKRINPSLSHGLAIQWAYLRLIKNSPIQYFGFIDHDVFPYKKTGLLRYLKDEPYYGLVQKRDERSYLWAGFCFFNKNKLSTTDLNFLPGNGLDTGGGNWDRLYLNNRLDLLKRIPHYYLKITSGGKLANVFNRDYNENEKNRLLRSGELVEVISDWCHLMGFNWRGSSNDKKHLLISNLNSLEKFLKDA